MSEWLVSKRDAARFFGVSTQALDGWFNRGCPVAERDGSERIKALSLPGMVAWRLAIAEGDEEANEIDREKVRLTRAQADKTEIEVDVMRGRLIPAEEVERVWTGMIGAARAKLLSLPPKVAPQVLALENRAEVEALLKTTVNAALAELAAYRHDDYAGTPSSEEHGGVGPAAGPDGVGLGERPPTP